MPATSPDIPLDDASLSRALEQDARRAEIVLRELAESARTGHPATSHLQALMAGEPLPAAFVAAVALDAGVRCHLAAKAAEGLAHSGTHPAVASYLRQRDPSPWEAHPDSLYTEMDWPIALFAEARACLDGAFTINPNIPGAGTLSCILEWERRHGSQPSRLLADAPRNDVLDPIATTGAFLAQAMPGYADLDEVLRNYRLRRLAGQAPLGTP